MDDIFIYILMLGCYKKSREDIVDIIKKSPKTKDGYYVCKKFIELNKKIGEYKDNGYIYNREKYANKICFNETEIESYLEKKKKDFDIDWMKERDDFIYKTIFKDLDLDINEKIPNEEFTLGELIDCTIFFFASKH